jgi:glycerol-3-phosphate dehydrogenase
MYDVVIIGAGICGASIARELSKYKLKTLVLEKENDVSNGTSKANSGIVHGGYDPEEGTLMAKYNVKGNEMFEDICSELSVFYKKVGALVLGFSYEDKLVLEKLLKRGINNGAKGLKILSRNQVLELEPNLNSKVQFALYSPTVGVVDPWELTMALMENAVVNGIELRLNSRVTDIEKSSDCYRIIVNDKDEIETKTIINAAGLFGDIIHNMVSKNKINTKPVKGDYYIMDKCVGDVINKVIFQCPSEKGKGVLVSPTVDGNLIVGPDAVTVENRDNVNTSSESMKFVRERATESVEALDFRFSIRNFAGIRAYLDNTKDFLIGELKDAKGFIDCIGMKSPGLTSSLAIAEDMPVILRSAGIELQVKENFNGRRERINFKDFNKEEKNKLIKKDPSYGRIICRCEGITEGEIIESIKRPVGARTIDGVKKRCRPGSGRCQGSFCTIRVQEILAKELGVDIKDIVMDKLKSNIILGETKIKDGDGDV